MKWKYVLLDKSEGIATVTLNRPEKLNAFAGNMRDQILEALEDACADDEVRVIVFTGAGKAFCVGGDVDEFVAGKTQALGNTATSERLTFLKIVLLINSVEKPVIASVNGVAAGGGCNFALSCDIRIASDRARFGEVFVKLGVFPDWGGVYFLPRLVGYSKAAELLFSGEVIDANKALTIGMVNRVVPHDKLAEETRKFALNIANNAPLPIAFVKRGLQNFGRMDLAQTLDFEKMAVDVCWNSEDREEGFKSFLEKRPPIFKGR
ncbi:MAG: hypothetical protein B1H13_00355 [Desulfobacteraceae bacterium 4484_190.3]|nr:MAG: hypothetical protein B1H13_00355 [Desulfobacteraceae bacterium 4484_190.3]